MRNGQADRPILLRYLSSSMSAVRFEQSPSLRVEATPLPGHKKSGTTVQPRTDVTKLITDITAITRLVLAPPVGDTYNLIGLPLRQRQQS